MLTPSAQLCLLLQPRGRHLFHQSYRHDSDIMNGRISAPKSLLQTQTSLIWTEQQMNRKLYQPWRALKVLMFDSNKSFKWFGDHWSPLCKVFMKWHYDDLLPWYDFQLPQALCTQSDLLCYLWHWSIPEIVAIGFMCEPEIKDGNKSHHNATAYKFTGWYCSPLY